VNQKARGKASTTVAGGKVAAKPTGGDSQREDQKKFRTSLILDGLGRAHLKAEK